MSAFRLTRLAWGGSLGDPDDLAGFDIGAGMNLLAALLVCPGYASSGWGALLPV